MTKRECYCRKCEAARWLNTNMIMCSICDNKRCPHAEDHDLLCMGSNAPNQPKVLRHPRAPLTLSQSEAAN